MKWAEVLLRAREVIKTPKTWTKGAFARDKDGTPTLIMGEDAVSFCLNGAILRVVKCDVMVAAPLWQHMTKFSGKESLEVWHDRPETNHDMVIALLEEVRIDLLKAECAGKKRRK